MIEAGDKICMVRDYDGGRLPAGAVYVADYVESHGAGPDEVAGVLPVGICQSLCRPAVDGDGPFAEPVDPAPEPTLDDTDDGTEGDD